MAHRLQVVLIDDIDGGEAAETVSFALDGDRYEIDLNDVNARRLRTDLAPYVNAAREVPGAAARARVPGKAPKKRGPADADVRAWAKENGIDVKPFGKVPSALTARSRDAAGR